MKKVCSYKQVKYLLLSPQEKEKKDLGSLNCVKCMCIVMTT